MFLVSKKNFDWEGGTNRTKVNLHQKGRKIHALRTILMYESSFSKHFVHMFLAPNILSLWMSVPNGSKVLNCFIPAVCDTELRWEGGGGTLYHHECFFYLGIFTLYSHVKNRLLSVGGGGRSAPPPPLFIELEFV